jgi:hypothetical protein
LCVTRDVTTVPELRRRRDRSAAAALESDTAASSETSVMYFHKVVAMGPEWSPASSIVGGVKRSEPTLVYEGPPEDVPDSNPAASSENGNTGFTREISLAPTERYKSELRPLEDSLRRREQQLAVVTLALRAKRNGSAGGCEATIEELDSARRKLEIELFRLRQAIQELQQRPRPTTHQGKVSLEELDKALGIKEVVQTHEHVDTFESQTQRLQVEKQKQEALTPAIVLTALQKLRREEAEERISETRSAVKRALNAGNALSGRLRIVPSHSSGQDSWEYPSPELQDIKPEDLARLPGCSLLVSGTELSQKRRRLEMAPTRDYMKVLQPDAQAPFLNKVDAWQRLEPYHVFLGAIDTQTDEVKTDVSTAPPEIESRSARLENAVTNAETRFAQLRASLQAILAGLEIYAETESCHRSKA